MFSKILVVCRGNIFHKDSETLNKIKPFLKGRKSKIMPASRLNKSYFKDVELVITIGGDGTFLKAASFVQNQFILGINSDPRISEGALTSLTMNKFYMLREILNGKFNVFERQRARASKNGKDLDKLALNEVYIGSRSQFHTSRYKIYFKGRTEEHRSSGVLVSTGTGSKAWYASAGGKKPFDPREKKLKFIVREPFFGKLFRPSILQGDISKGEKIKIELTGKLGSIVFDSNTEFSFEHGDVVEVWLANEPLKVLTLKGGNV